MPFEFIEDRFINTAAAVAIIISNELTSREKLEKVIQGIHQEIVVKTFSDLISTLKWIPSNLPDLIVIDLSGDGMAGLESIKQMNHIPALQGVPVLAVTSPDKQGLTDQVLAAGATDFITLPIDPNACQTRSRILLQLRLQHKYLLGRSQWLEQRVDEVTKQIHAREQETLYRLAKAGEYRDEETGNHIIRMAKYSRLIAEGLGLEAEHCQQIELASPMHDIGKIGIPDQILRKPGKLTPEEFTIMKTHPLIGYRILQDSPSKFLKLGATIALAHHEKYDGSGYPYGTKGDKIPLEARIVAVADVYDVLTSYRPYKDAWSTEKSVAYLTSNRGIHFDPVCVDAFLKQFSLVEQIQNQLRDIPETTLVKQAHSPKE